MSIKVGIITNHEFNNGVKGGYIHTFMSPVGQPKGFKIFKNFGY